MKVLLINQFPLQGGGSGIYTRNLAKSLRDSGHEVQIIIPENTTKIEQIEGVKINPVFFKYKEEIPGQLPFNFPCFTTHPRSVFTFGQLTEEQLNKYENAFRAKIGEIVNTFKPDIIHSGHIWILSSIATEFNIPTIVSSHGTDIIGYDSWEQFHRYCSNAVEKCENIVTISQSNNEQVLQRFPYAKNKSITIVNGYDQEIFSRKKYDKQLILNKLGITNKYDNIVLLSGRLVHVKGIDILLKAAKIYEKENIVTLIAGEGILHKELEEFAKKLKLKNVFFLGAKTQTELNELYNIADVTVLSSRYEGLALVVIEALACGTPVVVTNIEAMNGFMKKEFGLVVEKENPQALANGIIKTLSEKEKYKNEEIAEYIKNNYSTKQIIDNIIELYKNCL
jgi:glycosyltransferase involved in cell wall biosynthesis